MNVKYATGGSQAFQKYHTDSHKYHKLCIFLPDQIQHVIMTDVSKTISARLDPVHRLPRGLNILSYVLSEYSIIFLQILTFLWLVSLG